MNLKSPYYLLDGKTPVPCTIDEWVKHFGKTAHVARDTIGGITISTVFLGVDCNCRREGAPLLFETVIFDCLRTGHRWRYATYDEAKTTHEKIVDAVGLSVSRPDLP